MADDPEEKKSGCGILNAVFGRRNIFRRSPSSSIPTENINNVVPRTPSTPNSKRRRGSSDETAFLDSGVSSETQQKSVGIPIARPGPNHSKAPPAMYHQNYQGRKAPDAATMTKNVPNQGYGQGRRVPQAALGISGELESMIADHQRTKGASNLVLASSGNVMLHSNLGNLRQSGGTTNSNSTNVLDYLPKTAKEESTPPNGKNPTSVMGNVVKKPNEESEKPTSLCRALSTRMDPETLKIMGNEDYKNGRFADALALYDAAISIDPNKASYRSNKSAALTALGRLLEAVFECREAIRIEPYYQRAHNRLANLYLRLGEAEKAMYHHKHAGAEADPDYIAKQPALPYSGGADSAPLIFALQAEALLKLHRHQEADEALTRGPNFDVDDCTKFFGPISNATLLVLRAQVDMAAGRIDDAVAAAQRAARLDSNNKEVNMVVRRTMAVAAARSKGNELFKASRYSEACVAYGEGLDHDHYNSVLLCNRAACRSKLGQFDKAIEDCTTALNVRPTYTKARLRRADCNAKLENWEACIQDYEVLIREAPEDEEIDRGLKEAQLQLKKQRGRDSKQVGGGAHELVVITSNEHFRDCIESSPVLSVVLFCNKPGDRQTLHFMEQLCKRYPPVNFFKVEVEDHSSLAKSEGVCSLPAFKLYKTGSRPKEIAGDNHELLESSIKFYTT
ncbi:hypothetical protein F0562_003245 [Nyssa sinensis]|uniref:Thioredoxin domain-containing protein n=1 Tax=Nyssa sinensis TaxID=561372 RepID=A0A5J5C038_9ASTE|nr:hypothetical protein F0562_003245 [Nyssa sinensis]